jgi:hypothetical protein
MPADTVVAAARRIYRAWNKGLLFAQAGAEARGGVGSALSPEARRHAA